MLRTWLLGVATLVAGLMECHAAPSIQWFKSFGAAARSNSGLPIVTANSEVAYAWLRNGSETTLNKFDVSGNLVWSRPLTAFNFDALSSPQVSVDHLDNAYLSWSQGDWTVQKHNPNGEVEWTRTLGTPASDNPGGTVIDGQGNVYIGGRTAGSLAAVHQGSWDPALAKYDAAGNLQWSRQWGTSDIDIVGSIVVDGVGNVLLGTPRTPIESPGSLPSETSIRKVSPSGDTLWTRPFAGYGQVLTVDNLGNSLIHVRPPGAGINDNDIAKLSPDGDILWTRQIDSFGGTADLRGNLYVTRWSTGELDKYGPDGEHLWTLSLTDGALGNFSSINVDAFGNIFISGHTLGPRGVAGPVLDVWLARVVEQVPEPSAATLLLGGLATATVKCRRQRSPKVRP